MRKISNRKIKRIKLVVIIIIEIALIKVLLTYGAQMNQLVSELLKDIAVAMLPPLFGVVVDNIDNVTWKEDLRYLLKHRILGRDDKIRISFSYLYRIRVDGKYLLVKNERGTNKFQPVGGVYKFEDEEWSHLQKLNVTRDDGTKADYRTENDYRLKVPARNLRKFVRDFDKTTRRENLDNLSREFVEELVTTNILKVSEIKYKYCGRHYARLEYSKYVKCYELLMADIVELLPTADQKAMLRELMGTDGSGKYLWADNEQIKSGGTDLRNGAWTEIIADHSCKILEECQNDLVMKKKSSLFSLNIGENIEHQE